ncbi:MAG TPA: pantoate--beta-alanine ligase [Dehalococcoidia bacterium]|nr:pantoate--beta-alanine ligase [Dehalococcoidia bacterium]
MKVISTVAEFKEARRKIRGTVGFVPTMGYLHEGHLFLARRAKAENDVSAVSIFVNPTQFGPKEDFARYPRDPDRDLALLEKERTDLVLMPPVEEMYPPGISTWVDVEGVTKRLEGAARPGHFRGVATVVAKLFNIVEPSKAYFGQKDAQQVVVIQKMVTDLNMNLEVVAVPTLREPDGLAMSSRNVYLNPEERQAAVVLWRSMNLVKGLQQKGERDAEKLRNEMVALIKKEPLARIDYVSIADPRTLDELSHIKGSALVSMAVYIGKTRLIDNLILGE